MLDARPECRHRACLLLPCLYGAQRCRGVSEQNLALVLLGVLADGLCGPRALLAKALEMGLLHGQNLPPPGITAKDLRTVRGVDMPRPAMAISLD